MPLTNTVEAENEPLNLIKKFHLNKLFMIDIKKINYVIFYN